MLLDADAPRDLAALRVPFSGRLAGTDDVFKPFQLIDPAGSPVMAVDEFMVELFATGRSGATQRSYGMDLLRWFRFLWAVEVAWDRAGRDEARDYIAWLRAGGRGERPHWRRGAAGPALPAVPGRPLAASTIVHAETVARTFYAFHVERGSGPVVSPFPLARGTRAGAHHDPARPFRPERAGRYRPSVPQRVPRQIPDEVVGRLFAALGSHRDRAMVAFWVSTGARASELLGAMCSGVDPGQQLITVVRKGSRAVQQLPASPDAFVWLRLYQEQFRGLVPAAGDEPVWWTLRRPLRPLAYHAARAMFERAAAGLGRRFTLHDLRHTAAYRLARDPLVPITDVQWVLGHAHLSTTQRYVAPTAADVIADVLAHHRRPPAPPPAAAPGYRAESLGVLFGGAGR
jgi:site-specific recombinase XerD